MDETNRADLPAIGDEDVDVLGCFPVAPLPDRSSADAVTSASLDAGENCVLSTQQQGRADPLILTGCSGEQQHHTRQDPLPRSAVQTTLVHSALRETEGNQLTHAGHPERKGVAKFATSGPCQHPHAEDDPRRSPDPWANGRPRFRKATFRPSQGRKVAFLNFPEASPRGVGGGVGVARGMLTLVQHLFVIIIDRRVG
ncbi:hypothetical protein [Pseudonocardia xinjiangensis]|uniref:hypothetical protein n=1 Tax=Pseudonocardia xinjiangensis TaxID=75289 RepID=UPI0031D9741F